MIPRLLRAFVRFWVELVLGDDWLVAAIVGGALLASGALVLIDLPAWWLVPLAVVLAAATSLRRAVSRGG